MMWGNPPEVKPILMMKNETEEMMWVSLRKSTLILITKNRKNVGGNLSKLLGIPPEVNTDFDNEK